MLRQLCKQYTKLNDEDILQLEMLENQLPSFTALFNRDIFIDCLIPGMEYCVIVAHERAASSEYPKQITGEIIKLSYEPAVYDSYLYGKEVQDLKGVTQENKIIRQSAAPIRNKNNEIIAILVYQSDITESWTKYVSDQDSVNTNQNIIHGLHEDPSINNTNLLTDEISDGIIIFNKHLVASFANNEAKNIYSSFGFGDQLIGLSLDDLSLDFCIDTKKIATGEVTEHEVVIGHKTLKIRYKISNTGEQGLVMLLTDITDIKNKEKELGLKSVVVQEMHHRIKNNLQIIVSFLNMQVRCSTNEETIRALHENISRISNISAIHEILCQGEPTERVSIYGLTEKIRSNILKYATVGQCPIEINIAGDDFSVGGNQAVSIALVMNELISNSIRHAFTGRESGIINIILAKGTRFCSISVSDNGIGYDVEKTDKVKMGLKIVRTTVQDSLKGKVHISSTDSGTRAIFEFKCE